VATNYCLYMLLKREQRKNVKDCSSAEERHAILTGGKSKKFSHKKYLTSPPTILILLSVMNKTTIKWSNEILERKGNNWNDPLVWWVPKREALKAINQLKKKIDALENELNKRA